MHIKNKHQILGCFKYVAAILIIHNKDVSGINSILEDFNNSNAK
jgi:hypothetical protein